MATWQSEARDWKKKYPSSAAQAEYFLLRFNKDSDITRHGILELLKQFDRFDGRRQGELEEDEALRLLEHRKETKTVAELRQLVKDIDLDHNHKLCFLELCCSVYKKSWALLHAPSHDPAELALLSELSGNLAQFTLNAQKHSEEMAVAEANKLKELSEIEHKKAELGEERANKEAAEMKKRDEEHRREQEKKAEEQRRMGQGGAKGAAAMFENAGNSTSDRTASNAEKIKAEAAHRRELKRIEDEQKKTDQEAKKAGEEAQLLAAAKHAAEADANRIGAEAAEADRKRRLAEQAKAEKEVYEAAKAQADAEARAQEEKKRREQEESRKRLAEKASAFK